MKKLLIVAALVSIFNASLSNVCAQTVVSNGFNQLKVSYKATTPELQMVDYSGNYTLLTLPGYISGGEVGAPALPVRNDIIEVPFCDNIVVTVENAVYDTIQLSKYMEFYPLQPSRFKSDTTRNQGFVIDRKIYDDDAFWGLPLAKVEVMGVARDRRLAQLSYSPIQVNPTTGQIVVCLSADVVLTYVNADVESTLSHYQRYHTPAFSVGTTLNNLYSNSQALKQSVNQPVRMVIAVPNLLRCNAIERFANWKRRQGLLVDLLYYQDLGISSNTALAAHFKTLYDSASIDSPAPTYILLVGDHNQLRAFDSELPYAGYWSSEPGNDHITDLYFATWTPNDHLPDCYQGRFSASDTATLANIVNKTLLYEQYAFSDDAYLSRAVLIAGEDDATHGNNDYAWYFADPTMDYIAYNYINATNGYHQVSYYKNDTSYAPSGVTVTGYCSATSSASALRNLYNTGIGWINYSAHGDWDKWHKPNLTVSHVNSMSNNNMPSFVIGNCCLTNKFDKSTCFGEALLRKNNNAGAVAYIGGTNSTLWTEDFYWTVGVRSNIVHRMSPTYNSEKLGIYDRFFHTHSESFSQHAATAGAIVYYGNVSVNNSTSSSSMKKYYWEIYELMGDPSLLPWAGRASDLPISLVNDGNTITITTAPNTYLAILDTATLLPLFAGHADQQGLFEIPSSAISDINHTLLSATCQHYKPYFRLFANDPLGIDSQLSIIDSQLSLHPNPAFDHVTLSGLPSESTVQIFDAQGRLQLTQSHCHSATMSVDISMMMSGIYIFRIITPQGILTRKLIKK